MQIGIKMLWAYITVQSVKESPATPASYMRAGYVLIQFPNKMPRKAVEKWFQVFRHLQSMGQIGIESWVAL